MGDRAPMGWICHDSNNEKRTTTTTRRASFPCSIVRPRPPRSGAWKRPNVNLNNSRKYALFSYCLILQIHSTATYRSSQFCATTVRCHFLSDLIWKLVQQFCVYYAIKCSCMQNHGSDACGVCRKGGSAT